MSVADFAILPRPHAFASLVEGVILSWGWRRRAIAFVSGAVGALALPPLSLFPLIAVPRTIAVWLIDGAQERGSGRPLSGSLGAAFGAGWWMGFGYFLAGLWWVGSALLVEADKFAGALPLAGRGAAGCARGLSRRGLRLGAAPVVAGAASRFRPRLWARSCGMGARPPVHRLSLERPWHGARRQSYARPDRLPRRPARAHFPDHSRSSLPRRRYGG